VRQHETQGLRQAAADGLGVTFEGEVVGQIELTDTRGIAAAAQILHQQCVIQLTDLAFRLADLAPDVNADPASADAMALRLPLA
jgi:hypothetical protein